MNEPKEVEDWKFICQLGVGAFGEVTLWRNRKTEEPIAVKKCKFKVPSSLTGRQKERWINEVDIMKSMNNQNIVCYKALPACLQAELEKDNPTKLPILSMEYCSKGNLRKFLLQTQNLNGCEEEDVRCILHDICNAVSYLHGKNITHRDIKPENIVIKECDTRPGKNIYKLIDLGYAKELNTEVSFVGTLYYLAPEIFNNQPYTNSVDLWSFGVLAYEVATGEYPFLLKTTPVERFQYLEKKSDEDIGMSLLKNGDVAYSRNMSVDNHLSPILKRDIEDWLRLLLTYDSKKRGCYNNERKDVFEELQTVLRKKLLKVFSVFNYCTADYEIGENTTLSDIKSLIVRDMSIPRNDQMFIRDRDTIILDDNTKLIDFFLDESNIQVVLYVYKKNDSYVNRTVAIPSQVQALFTSIDISAVAFVRKLYSHALFFINKEKTVMAKFNTALILQSDHTSWLFRKMKKLYYDVRNNLFKLLTQIECFSELTERRKQDMIQRNVGYLNSLTESRTHLRQAKELAENFNSLTARFLKVLEIEWVTKHSENLKTSLGLSERDMETAYKNVTILYQKVDSKSPIDVAKSLSNVVKIQRKRIFDNKDLQVYLRHSLSAQRKLQKLLPWISAIDEEIKRVQISICECEKIKYNLAKYMYTRTISIPNYCCKDSDEINKLIMENQTLRYQIQDASSEGSAYIRKLQEDLLYFWNGVVPRPSLH